MSDKYRFTPTGDVILDAGLKKIYDTANVKYNAIKEWEAQELTRIRYSVIQQEADLESDLIDQVVDVRHNRVKDLERL